MSNEPANERSARETTGRIAGTVNADGAVLAAAATVFFAGSAVLTQSGQPGASTPVPWMASHFLWFVATGLAAVGVLALYRRREAFGAGIAGPVAAGAFGLAVLDALQWTAWVYVDIFARQGGAHESLHGPLLHPFGTGHALMYGVLVGLGVASLAWAVDRSRPTHRLLTYGGLGVGTATAVVAAVALVTVADVREPASLATVVLLAASWGWLLVAGVALGRDGAVRTAG